MTTSTFFSNRLFRTILIALCICGTSACGAIYKPSPFWGASGYSSKDVDERTVRVSYLTGATADANTAKTYALYRCAELTLERGFDGFIVLQGDANSIGGPYGYTTSSTIVMQMFKGDQSAQHLPEKNGGVYYAGALMKRLEPRIKR